MAVMEFYVASVKGAGRQIKCASCGRSQPEAARLYFVGLEIDGKEYRNVDTPIRLCQDCVSDGESRFQVRAEQLELAAAV